MAAATATANPLRVRLSPHWPHPPSARQYVFLSLPHMEALYGGAGGGGKTDALLMAALQYVDVPGYSALLLRRTYKQLTQAGQLLDLSRQWLAGHAKWDDGEAKWLFPSGATIRFGHLDSDRDLEDYSGPSYQFIGFDELAQFPERHYRFLFTRLRRTDDVPVPVRMRSASNPGGQGHRWVKQRFIDLPRDPARMFVPAKVADNPVMDVEKYVEALEQLDPETRAQILDGDWTVRPPGEWVFDHHGIDAAEALGAEFDRLREADEMVAPADQEIVVGIDWGIGETHTVNVWPLAGGGLYVLPGEVVAARGEPAELTREILDSAAVFDWPLSEARYDSAGAQQMRTFAANSPGDLGLWRVDFNKHKKRTVTYLRRLFRRVAQGFDHQVIAISPRNTVLLEQLRGLEFKDQDTGKIVKKDDHGPDALIAAAAPVAARYAQEELTRT